MQPTTTNPEIGITAVTRLEAGTTAPQTAAQHANFLSRRKVSAIAIGVLVVFSAGCSVTGIILGRDCISNGCESPQNAGTAVTLTAGAIGFFGAAFLGMWNRHIA